VPHNATPVLDDGGKMASPAEVGHWRLKVQRPHLGLLASNRVSFRASNCAVISDWDWER
jgi:hypothetical protein